MFVKKAAVLVIISVCMLGGSVDGFLSHPTSIRRMSQHPILHKGIIRHTFSDPRRIYWKHNKIQLNSSAKNHIQSKKQSYKKSTKKSSSKHKISIPKRAMDIYVNYVTRLWNETNTTQRKRIANQKAHHAIRQVQHLLRDGEEYVNIMNDKENDTLDDMEKRAQARYDLLNACDTMMEILGPIEEGDESENVVAPVSNKSNSGINSNSENVHASIHIESPGTHRPIEVLHENNIDEVEQLNSANEKHKYHDKVDEKYLDVMMKEDYPVIHKAIDVVSEEKKVPKKKKSRSVLFGAVMGAVVACWVFSGNLLFTTLFTLMTILGQLEYYRMVMRVGIYPARKISVVGACAMFITVSSLLNNNWHMKAKMGHS